jgi:hypothetical protein
MIRVPCLTLTPLASHLNRAVEFPIRRTVERRLATAGLIIPGRVEIVLRDSESDVFDPESEDCTSY